VCSRNTRRTRSGIGSPRILLCFSINLASSTVAIARSSGFSELTLSRRSVVVMAHLASIPSLIITGQGHIRRGLVVAGRREQLQGELARKFDQVAIAETGRGVGDPVQQTNG